MPSGKKSPLIGILLDHIESDYHVEMIASATRVATRRSARTIVIPGGALNHQGRPGRSRGFVYEFLASSDLDGLLIMGGSLSNYCGIDGFENFLRTLPPLPAVVVGLDAPSAVSVAVDNHHAMAQMMDHLVVHHRRRKVAFIDGPAESAEARVRRESYLEAISRHNLGFGEHMIVAGGLGREQGIDAVIQLLDFRKLTSDSLDAIVAVNDEVALGVLEELARRGISVPEEIAVVGFDDTPNAQASSPSLSTISQRVHQQGALSMTRLLDAVVSGNKLEREEIKATLVLRESCGCHTSMKNDTGRTRGELKQQAALFQRDEIALALREVAQDRLLGGIGWEERLTSILIGVVEGTEKHSYLVGSLAELARRAGQTASDVCHEVLTELRIQTLRRLDPQDPLVARMEDTFQETRLALSQVSSFSEREQHAAQALYLRVITRACLDRAHGAELGELAVALDEQLPLFGIRKFVISRGSEDLLQVISHSDKSPDASMNVSTSNLGRDHSLKGEQHVVVLPLSARKKQAGLAALSFDTADPYIFEQLRDLLGMALALD